MAANPIHKPVRAATLRLVAFDPGCAHHVVSWVQGKQEQFWLAPRTEPPLTPDKVAGWADSLRTPWMLVAPGRVEPLAYGELNVLNAYRREYWLGHLIVDPRERGAGAGRQLTRRLIDRAFRSQRARSVSLVVFPDNVAAVNCYRSAGMREDGYEYHEFPVYSRRERLSRFIVDTRDYEWFHERR